MRVRDVMSSTVYTISPTDTAGMAREMFKRYGIDQIVVTLKHKIAGIVADRDIARLDDNERVSTAMVHKVTTIAPDATLRKAAGMMTGHAIGSLPVVDDGRLVGILTTADLLRLISKGTIHPAPNTERQVLPRRGPRRKIVAL